MCSLYTLVQSVLTLYYWVLIAAAIMSWLLAFGVINRYNRAVAMIEDMLYRVTEPALRPIRRIVPGLGGVERIIEIVEGAHAQHGQQQQQQGTQQDGRGKRPALREGSCDTARVTSAPSWRKTLMTPTPW